MILHSVEKINLPCNHLTIMKQLERKNILDCLNTLKDRESTTQEEKVALNTAIISITRAKNSEDIIKVVELLVKLMGIGSNYFS